VRDWLKRFKPQQSICENKMWSTFPFQETWVVVGFLYLKNVVQMKLYLIWKSGVKYYGTHRWMILYIFTKLNKLQYNT
jgi:hypothetical protein